MACISLSAMEVPGPGTVRRHASGSNILSVDLCYRSSDVGRWRFFLSNTTIES